MISVCMATFNGGKYIHQQIQSILKQIDDNDEVIICDDLSSDDTIKVIESFNDNRIRLYKNPSRLGHVKNFEKSMYLARGNYIMLSDQDDIWIDGRVELLKSIALDNPKAILVASNFDIIDAGGNKIREFRKLLPKPRFIAKQLYLILFGKSQYFGCTFLIQKRLLEVALPIPKCVESHDIWLALIASYLDGVFNTMMPTLLHRVHGENLTPITRRSIYKIIKSRICYLFSMVFTIWICKAKLKFY